MSSKGKFKLLENTIRDLFDADAKLMRYEIPLYQRSYTWNEEQIGPLLEDILSRVDDGNQHYMGIMATTNVEIDNLENTHTNTYIRVIDGQQRITTSILIISVLNQLIAEKNNFGCKGRFSDSFKKVTFRNEIDTIISKDVSKLVSNSSDESSVKSSIIKKNIEFIREFFNNYPGNLKKILETFLDLFKMGRLIYNIERDEEMLVFENLNSKGSPLDEFDLIRNYIISKNISLEQKGSKVALKKFNENVVNILKTGTLSVKDNMVIPTFEKYIKFFLKWKGYEVKYKSYPLYKNFKKYSENTKIDFTELLCEIKKYIILYLSISHPKGNFKNKLWIRVNKKDSYIPMAFELFEKYSELTESDEWEWNYKIEEYFKVFSIHIIKLLSVEGTGQSLPSLISMIVKKINVGSSSEELKEWLSNAENVPSGNTPSNIRFEDSLNKRQTQKWIPEAIIDIIEYHSHGMNETINYNGRTLEHIMPQTPNLAVWGLTKMDEEHKEYINRIGNLAFLNRVKNTSAGNNSFEYKKHEFYSESMSPLLTNDEISGIKIKKVIDYIEWKTSDIENRTKELTKIIIKIMK